MCIWKFIHLGHFIVLFILKPALRETMRSCDLFKLLRFLYVLVLCSLANCYLGTAMPWSDDMVMGLTELGAFSSLHIWHLWLMGWPQQFSGLWFGNWSEECPSEAWLHCGPEHVWEFGLLTLQLPLCVCGFPPLLSLLPLPRSALHTNLGLK